MISSHQELRCSFCGKPESEIKKLLEGGGNYICDECILFGVQYISDEEPIVSEGLLKPIDIKKFLDNYVISQDKAKTVLSVAVYNHFKRLNHSNPNVELQKSNIALIGFSGTGKTLLAQTLARILNVPFTIADATSLTESGYVGSDVESIFQPLLTTHSVEEVEKAIVYIDEVDKKARKSSSNPSLTRDVSGESVQYALLKLLEGSVIDIPNVGKRKHPNEHCTRLDTSNILFILGGAFNGLADIIAERQAKNTMGFLSEKNTVDTKKRENALLQEVTHKDLINFGIIPELAGRIPILATLNDLNVDDLCKILIEPKNSLVSQYKEFLAMDNVELIFEPDALREIAKKANKMGTGARGLRSIMEDLMLSIMFEVPSENVEKCIVTKECVTDRIKPKKVIKKAA